MLRQERLRAACGARQEERGLKPIPKTRLILAGNLIRKLFCDALVPILHYGFKSFKLFGKYHFWDFLEKLLDDQLEKARVALPHDAPSPPSPRRSPTRAFPQSTCLGRLAPTSLTCAKKAA